MNFPFDTESAQRQPLREVIDALESVECEVRVLEARKRELLAEASRLADLEADELRSAARSLEMAHRAVGIETARVLGISPRAASQRLGDAVTILHDYPATHAMQSGGAISSGHAAAISTCGLIIEDSIARRGYEREMLELAAHETVNRVWKRGRIVAEKYVHRSFEERHAEARERRCVWVEDLEDGMAELHALLPAQNAYLIKHRLDGCAKKIQTGQYAARRAAREAAVAAGVDPDPADLPEVAPREHLRADVFTNLLLNRDYTDQDGRVDLSGVKARIQVTVPVFTLLGDPAAFRVDGAETAEHAHLRVAGLTGAAILAGYGPIDPSMARLFASLESCWDHISVHPDTAGVLAAEGYRPTADIKRFIHARDQHCRAPGCTIVPHQSDIDHTIDAALGGETVTTNLAVLSRGCHTSKHHAGMHMKQCSDGVIEWTTPLGHVIRDVPSSTITLRPPKHPSARPPGGTGTSEPRQRRSRVRFDPCSDEPAARAAGPAKARKRQPSRDDNHHPF
ncbi:MAG: DUF222 domain-containing protein [Leucobacter sp.]